jgi:hypothetical protein
MGMTALSIASVRPSEVAQPYRDDPGYPGPGCSQGLEPCALPKYPIKNVRTPFPKVGGTGRICPDEAY